MIQDQLASLATLSSEVLTGGVAFLYDQAGELLEDKQDNERRDELDERPRSARIAEIEGQPSLTHVPNLSHVDETALSRLRGDIQVLRGLLRLYREGELPVAGDNTRLLERIVRLRVALQAVYGQRIELLGEDPESIPSPLMSLDVVIAIIRAGVSAVQLDDGRATGIQVRDVVEVDVSGDLTIGRFGTVT